MNRIVKEIIELIGSTRFWSVELVYYKTKVSGRISQVEGLDREVSSGTFQSETERNMPWLLGLSVRSYVGVRERDVWSGSGRS